VHWTQEYDAFVKELQADQYQTPAQPVKSALDRMFGRRDTWYYLRIFEIVIIGWWLARRNLWNKRTWFMLAFRTLRFAEACGARVTATGTQAMERVHGPAVIVANHMSLLETFVLGSFVIPFSPMTVILKESLVRMPLFGRLMRAADPISVTRRNPRDDLRVILDQGGKYLKAGKSILVFPQSTRSTVFDPAKFNSVGVKLARKAGVPVVPVALKTDFHGTGRIVRDFGPVDRSQPVLFRFGNPIPVTGNGRAAHEAALSFMTSTLKEWGVTVLENEPAASAENVAEEGVV